MPAAVMPLFDTLKHTDSLKEAGFTDAQARAQVRLAADIVSANLDRFATKDDLRQVATELRGEMSQLSAELRGEMNHLSASLGGDMNHLSADLSGRMDRLDEKYNHVKWMLGTMMVLMMGGFGWMITLLRGMAS